MSVQDHTILRKEARVRPWHYIKQCRRWHRLPAGAHSQDACATSFKWVFRVQNTALRTQNADSRPLTAYSKENAKCQIE